MKLLVVLAVLTTAVGALACSEDDDSTAIRPTSTAARFETAVSSPSVPTPTIPPFPTVLPAISTSGWIVFHRGADLWAAKLDGSVEFPLVKGAPGSQFAGVATGPDDQRTLYFTALTEVQGAELPIPSGGTLEVRRRRLDGEPATEVVVSTRIAGRDVQRFRFAASNASISPDGQHLVYADEAGLWLRYVSSGSSQRLLGNNDDENCDDVSIGLCSSFREPSWSPAGEWLVLTRGLYEGGVADFIRPVEPVTEYTSEIGALWREWSVDGVFVCGPVGHVQIEGWGVVKPGEPVIRADGATTLAGEYRDLDEELARAGVRVGGWITSCAWADDGRIAVQYMHDERGSDQRIAVLAADGALVAEVDPPLNQSGLVGWLPDQSGFILAYGDGEGRPLSFIVLLDGTVHAPPVETDDVVAILPE